MKSVKVEEAVGHVLCHDLTRIIPGQFKGPAFKKGHIIKAEDIPEMLKMGKEHIYIWEAGPGIIHENEAAERIARAAAGENIVLTSPAEGKVNMRASRQGLLKVNVDILDNLNSQDLIMMATLRTNRIVDQDQVLAGTRIIPLVIEEDKIEFIEKLCRDKGPVLKVLPLLPKQAGIIITGNEVSRGRIKDSFGPIVAEKIKKLVCDIIKQAIVADNAAEIAAAVKETLAAGAEIILVTGGMSVDPDDVTPAGIKKAGGIIITYGTPVLPGAMFMMSYIDNIPVLGLPGCVMYAKTTVFDIILPRLLAGEILQKQDFARLGHGGLCQNCPDCKFPNCPLNTGF